MSRYCFLLSADNCISIALSSLTSERSLSISEVESSVPTIKAALGWMFPTDAVRVGVTVFVDPKLDEAAMSP